MTDKRQDENKRKSSARKEVVKSDRKRKWSTAEEENDERKRKFSGAPKEQSSPPSSSSSSSSSSSASGNDEEDGGGFLGWVFGSDEKKDHKSKKKRKKRSKSSSPSDSGSSEKDEGIFDYIFGSSEEKRRRHSRSRRSSSSSYSGSSSSSSSSSASGTGSEEGGFLDWLTGGSPKKESHSSTSSSSSSSSWSSSGSSRGRRRSERERRRGRRRGRDNNKSSTRVDASSTGGTTSKKTKSSSFMSKLTSLADVEQVASVAAHIASKLREGKTPDSDMMRVFYQLLGNLQAEETSTIPSTVYGPLGQSDGKIFAAETAFFYPTGFGSPKSELKLCKREIWFRKKERDQMIDKIQLLERENKRLRMRLDMEEELAASVYQVRPADMDRIEAVAAVNSNFADMVVGLNTKMNQAWRSGDWTTRNNTMQTTGPFPNNSFQQIRTIENEAEKMEEFMQNSRMKIFPTEGRNLGTDMSGGGGEGRGDPSRNSGALGIEQSFFDARGSASVGPGGSERVIDNSLRESDSSEAVRSASAQNPLGESYELDHQMSLVEAKRMASQQQTLWQGAPRASSHGSTAQLRESGMFGGSERFRPSSGSTLRESRFQLPSPYLDNNNVEGSHSAAGPSPEGTKFFHYEIATPTKKSESGIGSPKSCTEVDKPSFGDGSSEEVIDLDCLDSSSSDNSAEIEEDVGQNHLDNDIMVTIFKEGNHAASPHHATSSHPSSPGISPVENGTTMNRATALFEKLEAGLSNRSKLCSTVEKLEEDRRLRIERGMKERRRREQLARETAQKKELIRQEREEKREAREWAKMEQEQVVMEQKREERMIQKRQLEQERKKLELRKAKAEQERKKQEKMLEQQRERRKQMEEAVALQQRSETLRREAEEEAEKIREATRQLQDLQQKKTKTTESPKKQVSFADRTASVSSSSDTGEQSTQEESSGASNQLPATEKNPTLFYDAYNPPPSTTAHFLNLTDPFFGNYHQTPSDPRIYDTYNTPIAGQHQPLMAFELSYMQGQADAAAAHGSSIYGNASNAMEMNKFSKGISPAFQLPPPVPPVFENNNHPPVPASHSIEDPLNNIDQKTDDNDTVHDDYTNDSASVDKFGFVPFPPDSSEKKVDRPEAALKKNRWSQQSPAVSRQLELAGSRQTVDIPPSFFQSLDTVDVKKPKTTSIPLSDGKMLNLDEEEVANKPPVGVIDNRAAPAPSSICDIVMKPENYSTAPTSAEVLADERQAFKEYMGFQIKQFHVQKKKIDDERVELQIQAANTDAIHASLRSELKEKTAEIARIQEQLQFSYKHTERLEDMLKEERGSRIELEATNRHLREMNTELSVDHSAVGASQVMLAKYKRLSEELRESNVVSESKCLDLEAEKRDLEVKLRSMATGAGCAVLLGEIEKLTDGWSRDRKQLKNYEIKTRRMSELMALQTKMLLMSGDRELKHMKQLQNLVERVKQTEILAANNDDGGDGDGSNWQQSLAKAQQANEEMMVRDRCLQDLEGFNGELANLLGVCTREAGTGGGGLLWNEELESDGISVAAPTEGDVTVARERMAKAYERYEQQKKVLKGEVG